MFYMYIAIDEQLGSVPQLQERYMRQDEKDFLIGVSES